MKNNTLLKKFSKKHEKKTLENQVSIKKKPSRNISEKKKLEKKN